MEDTQIKDIPHWGFYTCENLKEVALPDDLVTIGDNVLRACSFTSIELSTPLKDIQGVAF